jgi:hypothetical protein
MRFSPGIRRISRHEDFDLMNKGLRRSIGRIIPQSVRHADFDLMNKGFATAARKLERAEASKKIRTIVENAEEQLSD